MSEEHNAIPRPENSTPPAEDSPHQDTSLTKYMLLGLFVMLPFVGAWIGYQYGLAENDPHTVTGSEDEALLAPEDEFSFDSGVVEAAELQELFAIHHGSEVDIELLHTSDSTETIYFRVLTNSSAPARLMGYRKEDAAFYETEHWIDSSGGDRVSPEGRFIALIDDYLDPVTSVVIIDLEDEEEAYLLEVWSGETLWSELCGYAGPVFDLNWTSSTTLQYGVYSLHSIDSEGCDPLELLDQRTVNMKEVLVGKTSVGDDWVTYTSDNVSFQISHPEGYDTIITGGNRGGTDEPSFHLMDDMLPDVQVFRESIDGGRCFDYLCDREPKRKFTINDIEWSYVGESIYCGAGGCSPEYSVYRTIRGSFRYYLFIETGYHNIKNGILLAFIFKD